MHCTTAVVNMIRPVSDIRCTNARRSMGRLLSRRMRADGKAEIQFQLDSVADDSKVLEGLMMERALDSARVAVAKINDDFNAAVDAAHAARKAAINALPEDVSQHVEFDYDWNDRGYYYVSPYYARRR